MSQEACYLDAKCPIGDGCFGGDFKQCRRCWKTKEAQDKGKDTAPLCLANALVQCGGNGGCPGSPGSPPNPGPAPPVPPPKPKPSSPTSQITPVPKPNPSPEISDQTSNGISDPGIIFGIIVGVLAPMFIIGLIVSYLWRKWQDKKEAERRQMRASRRQTQPLL